MQSRMTKPLACGLLAAALFASGAAHADLVLNGGFETGDFTNWSATIDPVYDGVDVQMPLEGTYAAYFGNGRVSTLSQTLATVAGTTYKVSFWLQKEVDANGSTTNSFFDAAFGSDVLSTLTNSSAFDYTLFEFSVMATGASTDLTFHFSDTAAFWDLDAVQVEAQGGGSVPEPASLGLLAAAGLGWLGAQRRRKPAVQPL